MTKEKIIDTILNSKVLEIYSVKGCRVYAASWIGLENAILSVSSKGIILIYEEKNIKYAHFLIPFEEVAKIVISKKVVLE